MEVMEVTLLHIIVYISYIQRLKPHIFININKHISSSCVLRSSWRSWRSRRSWRSYYILYTTYMQQLKPSTLITGLIAHSVAHSPLKLVVREDRGSIPAAAAILQLPPLPPPGVSPKIVCFFYKLRTMNYSKSRTKIGCQKTQLEIVEDLDNDFPVQYGTELYRKIIIQVPLEVQKLQIMELQDVPTDHMRGGQRTQKCAPDKLKFLFIIQFHGKTLAYAMHMMRNFKNLFHTHS